MASRLLPRALRRPVGCFYVFAREADDLVDDPARSSEAKLVGLDAFSRALECPDDAAPDAPESARALGLLLAERRLTTRHAQTLLDAFRQDAVKTRYADWAELMGYCRLSAAPVGRQVLDFAGESPEVYPHADALCNALQVLNHLQDLSADYRHLGRVYLPADWMTAEGAEEPMLARPRMAPELRRVVQRTLDQSEVLLDVSRRLPVELVSRPLAAECAAIQALAEALVRRLRFGDPLARRVALSKPAKLAVGLVGALSGYRRHRRHGPLLLTASAAGEAGA